MNESWRWYGSLDNIKLHEIFQTGAREVVTALHEVPYGQIWAREEIAARKTEICAANLDWKVCESLPIAEDIKRGTGNLSELFANYRSSMANLAAEGVHTICYNFMPVLDWTRTDLTYPVQGGGTCLRFEMFKMAAFDVFMLGRDGAADGYSAATIERAKVWFDQSQEEDRAGLLGSIMSGMPGAYDRYDIVGLREVLKTYDGIGAAEIRANYRRFLQEILPTAVELGIKMCVHPDDPPQDILGLPRVVSDLKDIDWILSEFDCYENGLTLCSGSLGANPDNDVVEIARKHAERIHFAHLRNVRKDEDGSFEEAAHLEGDTDLVAVIEVLLNEEIRRAEAGRSEAAIPFRPDHGHEILTDLKADNVPGYPLIGRLRGLSELRGVIHCFENTRKRHQ